MRQVAFMKASLNMHARGEQIIQSTFTKKAPAILAFDRRAPTRSYYIQFNFLS